MSDDAAGGARQGAHGSYQFHEAWDLKRRVVRIDVGACEAWTALRSPSELLPVLLRTPDGRWFCGNWNHLGGCYVDRFSQLTVEQALTWCTREGIDPPAKLIKAYESSVGCSNVSKSDVPAGAPNPSPLDPEGYAPNPPAASSPAPELQAPSKPRAASKQGARKVPRGMLDEHASIELTKNPSLTYEQLAEMLGCRPGTLRDKRKCPLLVAAKTRIKATKQEFYNHDAWVDQRTDEE